MSWPVLKTICAFDQNFDFVEGNADFWSKFFGHFSIWIYGRNFIFFWRKFLIFHQSFGVNADFLTKISSFGVNADVLTKISSFGVNADFLTKISSFDANADFLTKILIFDQHFEFGRKCWFFDQNLWQKF